MTNSLSRFPIILLSIQLMVIM